MEFSVYRRPEKPMYRPVRRRDRSEPEVAPLVLPDVVAVDRVTECHVTPLDVGERMVEYAQPFYGSVLEPQGGTGNLVQCLLDAGVSFDNITTVERHIALSESLRKRFHGAVEVHNDCFLDYAANAAKRFNHIVMNPPFKLCKKHMLAALSLLDVRVGSSLVAVVPVTFEHDGFYEVERLPESTFALAKVHTKIVMFAR